MRVHLSRLRLVRKVFPSLWDEEVGVLAREHRILHWSESLEKFPRTRGPVIISVLSRIDDRIRPMKDRSWRKDFPRTNGSSNPLCFNWRCTRQILSVPLLPSSVYTHQRIDPRTIKCRWWATPSERCVALPAEGWYDRVCPLERWKYVNRGWWLFFRSTDWSLPTVKISVWNEQAFLSSSICRICVYVDIYNTFYKHTSCVRTRGAHDQVFSTDRTQPLVAEPGEQLCRSISVPTSREKFGNRPTRGTRRQGNRT